MATSNPFPRTAKATTKVAAPKAAAPATNRWATVKADTPHTPLFPWGTYKVRVLDSGNLEAVPGRDQYHQVLCEIIAVADGEGAEGEVYAMINPVTGKASTSGLGRVKAFLVAACGYETEAEFNVSPYEDGQEVGRCVVTQVTKGNERKVDGVPSGDHFRAHAWSPLSDEDQE